VKLFCQQAIVYRNSILNRRKKADMSIRDKFEPSQHSKIFSFFKPSIASIVFISVFLSQIFFTTGGLLSDCDTGYHIRAGEYILNTHSIPTHDMFSFLSPPLPWVAHEWLPEIIMAGIHKISGLSGIVIFFSLLISIVYCFLFKILLSLKRNIIVAAFVIIFVIASSQIHWLARPHIFSMLFILTWYYLLDAYQYSNQRKILYFQIPLMLLWVNMHGGFILGLVLNGIYLFGNTVEFIFSSDPERNNHKGKVIFLGLISLACFIVSFANPFGYQIILFPFKLVSEKFIMSMIGEYLSPNFHSLRAIPFEAFLLFTLAVFALSKERLNMVELLLILLFLHMSLFSVRYIPLFGIIAAPIVTKHIEKNIETSNRKFINFLKKKSVAFSEIEASASDFGWPSMVLLVILLMSFSGQLMHNFDPEKKPVAASIFLQQEHITGNMFNNDEIGDYIIYRNYPMYKVFIDGRNDMYGVEILKEYDNVRKLEPGWEEILEKYNVTWIIYDSSSLLARYLMQNKDWRLIYADKVANIFLKNIPENQRLIQKYRNATAFID
jgi:hypothetical protein